VTGSVILGLDQGTSSTRCIALDRDLIVRGLSSIPVACSFPGPGLVEQDPDELSASARAAIADVGVAVDGVAAIGISNQTETFVVCERDSGRPIHPALVWQDRRTADRCAALAGHSAFVRERTGLELDATFPATKLSSLLEGTQIDPAELVYHDVASWLCGAEFCDASNAGRTLLCGLGGADWDDELLDLFGVPRAVMPPIVDCDQVDAALGAPVAAALGDQQASLFGLRCREPGMAKVTLGTGAFVLAQAGPTPPEPPPGVLASCAWRRRSGDTSFALEGFVPAAGAALDWFASLGVIPPAPQLDPLLATSSETTVIAIPALQGLGTPLWDASVRGSLAGLTRATTRAEIARAVVDGVLHQVVDAIGAIGGVRTVLLDGGLSRSRWIAQRLADLSGVRVDRAAGGEASATGAAMMAGLAIGFWESVDEFGPVATDLVCEPSLSDDVRADLRGRWSDAVSRRIG
jgi:glycerol kinase